MLRVLLWWAGLLDAYQLPIFRIAVDNAALINPLKILCEYLQISLLQAASVMLWVLTALLIGFWLVRRTERKHFILALVAQKQLSIILAQQLVEEQELTKKLIENEAERLAQHDRLLALERQQTLADERLRLMQDLHDGLGASLITTLAAIERRNLPQATIAEALRACIEDLRFVINSLEPITDIGMLLATLRFSLEERLQSATFELQWEVQELPALSWLTPSDALNILRFLQEALVNVLKHANASVVRVATQDCGEQITILIQDNGCGFDPSLIKHFRGLLNQAKRAERLEAELQIQSKLGQGTLLQLVLPVNK